MSWEPLWLSFQIAAIATILTVIVGVALALALHSPRMPARDLLDAIVSVPLVLPPTVLGYYLLAVIGANSALGELWERLFGRAIVFNFEAAVIAAAVGSLPLVVRSVRVGLEAIDPNLIAAARTLGASPIRVLFTVTLPLATPAIAAGAMMGFARALGDYGATMMVYGARPGGVKPTAIWVMDELNSLHEREVLMMSGAVTVFGVAMLYFANRMLRRHRG